MKNKILYLLTCLWISVVYSQEQKALANRLTDFTHITTKEVSYLPFMKPKAPLLSIPEGTIFKIINSKDNTLLIECSNGVKGHLSPDDRGWEKLIVAYGTVIHKPWSKSLESWQAGGSDYCVLDISNETPQDLPGRFLRSSAKVSFEKIKKFHRKKVKIIGAPHRPKPAKVHPMSQRPIGMKGPGAGKGIRVYGIWAMKETTNYMPEKLAKSFKGYELYSWQQQNKWYFCLITGTNRIKTFDEISPVGEKIENGWVKITVVGVKAFKDVLQRLPEGENLYWGTGKKDQELPEKSLRDDIKKFAANLKIQIFD
ncbi:hypothetical protein [Candidatus Uabimicrobium amorphum]|uniref:Uncharacterized protein n=1 Tax=Uabimicrobium amorphum TaxID=2596890 RepID=A0A5S9INH7_UABAM|nr:hypothetical protein [Candidatus Uabimicrobium amorphum]BBM84777.1 hypothetical protein UABAM_03138 [Candidatus Uabimicrobium amorphum]